MDDPGHLDPSALSFDEFVKFFFQRPEESEYWYLDPVYQSGNVTVSNPAALVSHATRLFSGFGAIAPLYTLPQIDHGIWALLTVHDLSLLAILLENSTPLTKRVERIRSMFHVYSDFVSSHREDENETCFYMWWDLLGDELWSVADLIGHKDRSLLDQDFKQLLDAMFDTLKRILELSDPYAQRCALHGLGHLHHPEVGTLVQEFIDRNRAELDDDALKWTERCRDGTVM